MGWFRKSRTAAGSMVPDPAVIPSEDVAGAGDAKSLQDRMHKYCRTEGLARFAVSFVADASSRVKLCGEAYVPGVGWTQDFELPETKDLAEEAKIVNTVVSKLRGKYTTQEQTVSSIVWHKRSAGELYLVSDDDPDLGVCYTPYGYKAVAPQKGGEGGVIPGYKLLDRPNGRMGNGARWVPASDVSRVWTPDPDFPLQPFSPLWSGLKDLDRYSLLGKVIDRAANSALLNRGLIWFPGEAMDEMVTVGGKQMPRLARDYYASSQKTQTSKSDSDVSAVAPFAVWYDSDFGEPKVIKFAMPLESSWFEMRSAVASDFARTVDLPSVLVLNGGAGGGSSSGSSGSGGRSNHWSDLLIDRRTFDMTIGRDLDTVTHEDLTRYFLNGQLKELGKTSSLKGEWRVGYDPTPLVVNQDRTLFALDSLRVGLISYKAAGKRLGFRADEMATEDDLKKLAELVTRSPQADGSTRIRRRQDSTDMGGQGTNNVLPMTASLDGLFRMEPRQLRALADQAERSADGIVWVDA